MTTASTLVALNMTQPNFYSFAAGTFNQNYTHNTEVQGTIYPDVLEVTAVVNGASLSYVFAGPSIQLGGTSPQTVVGGTVSAFVESAWNGSAYVPVQEILGMGVSATAFYQAFLTPTVADDVAMLQAAFRGNDAISGSGFADVLVGYGPTTNFTGAGGNDVITGGGGTNTSTYVGLSSQYKVTVVAGSPTFTVQDKVGSNGTDTLSNIQVLKFNDTTLDAASFTQAASLGSAQLSALASLYIATFNRAPDALGLDYWASQLTHGSTLGDIAKSFFVQPETLAIYPSGQPLSTFVNSVYRNVLGRDADAAGLNYYVGELQNGHLAKDVFLLAIINGAQPGTADAQVLANKAAVGLHFALTQGLNDATAAASVMTGVTSAAESVTAANQATDAFAASAATVGGTELVVQIVGIAP